MKSIMEEQSQSLGQRSPLYSNGYTGFGEPLIEIVPISQKLKKKGWLGTMRGTGKVGDIVAPETSEKDCEVLNS